MSSSSTSAATSSLPPSGSTVCIDLSQEMIRPFPKAPARPHNKSRKGKACVLTGNEEIVSILRDKTTKKDKKSQSIIDKATKKRKEITEKTVQKAKGTFN